MTTTQAKFCTFRLENLLFGIELEGVQEVMRHLEMTQVPLATGVIRGLINLRGQIVTAIDLRRWLEFQPRVSGALPMNVVIRSEDGALSLLVDEIGDVVEVNESSFEVPPETVDPRVRSMITGVHKLDKQLLHVLDTAKLRAIGGEAPAEA